MSNVQIRKLHVRTFQLQNLYCKQIPKEIGIIVVNIESGRKENVKRSSYQDIPDDNKNILKNSLLRTLFYQNMKSSTLYNSK